MDKSASNNFADHIGAPAESVDTVSAKSYDDLRGLRLSQSTGKKLLEKSFERVRLEAANFKPTDAMNLGTAIHGLCLRDAPLKDSCVVMPEGMTRRQNAGKKLCEEAEARGKFVLTIEEKETAKAVAKKIMADSFVRHWLSGDNIELGKTITELPLIWQHSNPLTDAECTAADLLAEKNFAACMGKPDFIVRGVEIDGKETDLICDIKTTARVFNAKDFLRGEMRSGGAMQAAAYTTAWHGWREDKSPPIRFMYVVAQTTPPFEVWKIMPDAGFMREGVELWTQAVKKWVMRGRGEAAIYEG